MQKFNLCIQENSSPASQLAGETALFLNLVLTLCRILYCEIVAAEYNITLFSEHKPVTLVLILWVYIHFG